MTEKTDLLTTEVVRQCLAEQVPGFVAVLAEALGLSAVDLLRRLQQAQRNAGEAAVIADLEAKGLVKPSGLVSIEDHNRLTAGPFLWTSTRIAADQFQAARAVHGCETEDDDKRLYRALQAYEWRRTHTVSPYDADLSHL